MQLRDLSRVAALVVAACGGLAACGGAGCGGTRTPTHPPDDSATGDAATGDSATGDAADDASVPPPDGGQGIGPLRVDPRNPRYFTDGSGKVVYLTGSHTWANLKDRLPPGDPAAPPFNYAAFLDFLIAHHHNFMRLWTWEQPHSADDDTGALATFSPFPWLRTGPGMANDGKLRFDLDKLDPAYFTRMRERVVAARDRGIYVAVMLFDGWDLVNAYNADSGGFPMGSGNNINNVAVTGPEVFAGTSSAVAARQQAYVRAVIDAVNDLDNVLYEIVNETDTNGVAWQYQMIDLVRTIERGKPKQHPVGMTSTYPGSDADLFASSADWISPNDPFAPGDGRKVILNDTDHSYGWRQLKGDGPTAQRAWAWKTLCAGASPLFMDPYLQAWTDRNNPVGGQPDPAWNTIRDAIGRTRLYAERLDLERAVPSRTLCSTMYCLADPGREYLVYLPPGGSTFTLTVVAGTYRFEWYNPASGAVGDTGMITVGAERHTFMSPFPDDAVLLLQK